MFPYLPIETIYNMLQLFEGWRKYILPSEEQLLIEGRVEDVKKKYPHMDSIIDALIEKDPSGNQKYLSWAAKQVNISFKDNATRYGTEEANRVTLLLAQEMADKIEIFHKHNQRLPRFGFSRDINSYKDYGTLRDAVDRIEQEETQAAKRAEEKKEAFSEAEVIDDTEDEFIVRPMSTQASCFFGRGTRWCISADRSNNYFQSYTGEGKMFYFVFLKHLSDDNRYKKLAFVIDRDIDLESVFDAEDTELDSGEIEEAFVQNLLHQATAEGAWMTYLWAGGDRLADEATKEDIALYLEALERLGIEWDPVPENEQSREDEFKWRNEEIREKAEDAQSYILEQIRDHAYQNPAGPAEEDYQKIQDTFDENSNHAYLYFEALDEGHYYYNGGMSFDFTDLEWIDEHADNDDVIEEIVREIADDNYVYVDEIEVYNEEARLDFTPDYDESGLDGFDSFASRVLDYDIAYPKIYDGVISKLKGLRLIPAPDMERERKYWPSEEEKAKQIELPGIMSENKIKVRISRARK